MVRRKSILPKQKSKIKNSSDPKSPTSSTPASTMIETPTRQSPRAKQLHKQISKVKSTEKKKKKKRSMQMCVGSKTFSISSKVLQEIRYYQCSTNNLIPKLPFTRLVQEIISSYIPEGRRIQRVAIEALQEASEIYLVQYFQNSYICSLHAHRSTLLPRDMQMVSILRDSI